MDNFTMAIDNSTGDWGGDNVWAISNALIQKLALHPVTGYAGIALFGEDGKSYDFDHIMRRFLEVAENLIKEGK